MTETRTLSKYDYVTKYQFYRYRVFSMPSSSLAQTKYIFHYGDISTRRMEENGHTKCVKVYTSEDECAIQLLSTQD
jgi:hypothetical protein